MSGNDTNGFIPDPDYDGWDGTYIGVKNPPILTHNLQKMLHYAEENNKSIMDLTEEETEMFRIPGR